MRDTALEPWVVELTESVIGPAPFAVGDEVRHPDGRQVRITGGRYWGERGLSNFWHWRPLLADGSLGEPESGYGWLP